MSMQESELQIAITATDEAGPVLDELKTAIGELSAAIRDLAEQMATQLRAATGEAQAAVEGASTEMRAAVESSAAGIAGASEEIGASLAEAGTAAREAGAQAAEGAAAAEEGMAGERAAAEETALSLRQLHEAGTAVGTALRELQEVGMAALGGAIAFGGAEELANMAAEWGESLMQLHYTLGVTGQEAEVLAAAMQAVGLSGTDAIRPLMTLDRQVQSHSKSLSAAQQALAEWGVQLTDAQGRLLPVTEQLQRLSEAYNRAAQMGQEQAFISGIFGPRGSQLAPLLAQFEELNKAAQQIHFAPVDPEQIEKNAESLKLLQMQMQQLEVAAGTALLPVLKAVSQAFADIYADLVGGKGIVQAIRDLAAAMGPAGTAVAAFAAAWTAVKLGAAVEEVVKAVSEFGVAAGQMLGVVQEVEEAGKAMVTLNLGAVLNPWTLAFVALAGAAALVLSHWDQIRSYAEEVWPAIRGAVQAAWSGIQAAVQAVMNTVFPFVLSMWRQVQAWAQSNWPAIQQIVTFAWTRIQEAVQSAVKLIGPAVQDTWNLIKSATQDAWNLVKDVVQAAWDVVSGVISVGLDLITGRWGKAWTDARNLLASVWNDIKSIVGDAIKALEDLVGGWAKGIVDTISSIGRAIASLSIFHPGGAPAAPSATASRAGVPAMAEGGIVMAPTFAYVGEAGPEAVIPLSSGRTMLAAALGGAGSAPVIQINVSGNVTRSEQELAERIARALQQRTKVLFGQGAWG